MAGLVGRRRLLSVPPSSVARVERRRGDTGAKVLQVVSAVDEAEGVALGNKQAISGKY